MKFLVRAKCILTDAGAPGGGMLENGAVLVSDGKIAAVDSYEKLRHTHPELNVLGNGRQLLLPGLIDAHSHGRGLTPIQKGVPNDYLENNLLDWAFMPVLDPELLAALCAVRHIRSGATLIHNSAFDSFGRGAFAAATAAIDTYLRAGIRLAYSPGVRNTDKFILDTDGFLASLPPQVRAVAEPLAKLDSKQVEEDYFALFTELYRKYHGENTKIFLSPSWAQACTGEFLLRAKETAEKLGKLPIHMHCLQTPIQKAYSLRKYGKTAIQYLNELGMLEDNLVLGHAIWITEQDMELLAGHKVSVTSHPSCNLAMRNGIAPVYFMQKKGINVALGMDDKTINDDEDIIMELRMMHKLHRVPGYRLDTPAFSALDVLKMATTNAARVTGFAGQAGAIRTGMFADMIVVDLERIMNSPWMSEDINILDAFMYRGLGTDVDSVIIGGQVVMQDRHITTLDEENLYREIRRNASKGISAGQQKYAQQLQYIKPYYQQWYNQWLKPEGISYYEMNSRR